MISFSHLVRLGRLGNQLFQIASTIGIAKKNNTTPSFSNWKYNEHFGGIITSNGGVGNIQVKEKNFHYDEYILPNDKNYDLHGYFQSAKYWEGYEDEIKNQFKFNQGLIDSCKEKLPSNGKPNIAIHIRRGDYVGNPSHYNLSMRYYINALEKFDWHNSNLVIFSDDVTFVKWIFAPITTRENVFFPNGSEIEDLCTMTLCDHFIIANSSFSWWGAYLGQKEHSIVVRPKEHFAGNQLKHDIKDFYLKSWVVVSDQDKIQLNDATFIVPVSYDSNDRAENLYLCHKHITSNFDTNFLVVEQGGDKFKNLYPNYKQVHFHQFHRTKMINDAVKESRTHIVVNLDADILMTPLQVFYACYLIKNGVDIVYPYDGNFKHLPRHTHVLFKDNLDWIYNKPIHGPSGSFGGAIFMDKISFMSVGLENEKFISWGPEDAERYVRFNKMGLDVVRMNGPIYHLDHSRGKNSGKTNPYIHANRAEWHKIRVMESQKLKEYIKTWAWI